MRPSLSPDGWEVACKWQQGTIIGLLGFWSSSVVVAAAAQPTERTLTWPIVWIAPNGRLADDVASLTWADDHTLRFLVGYEFIFKVKGGGQTRYTDTTFESFALAQLDAATGAFSIVPGGLDVLAYAPRWWSGGWLLRGSRESLAVRAALMAEPAL